MSLGELTSDQRKAVNALLRNTPVSGLPGTKFTPVQTFDDVLTNMDSIITALRNANLISGELEENLERMKEDFAAVQRVLRQIGLVS